MHAWTIPLADHQVQVRSTSVGNGDFAIPQLDAVDRFELDSIDSPFRQRRRAIIDQPWTWLRQVHGCDLVSVGSPGEGAGAVADGAFTTVLDAPIAVTTADCCPVVLVSTLGVAVVHAGWRGALAGIVERAGARLLVEGGSPVASILGPCIGVEHYEFGASDLALMAAAYGHQVRGTSGAGSPALDMATVIATACERAGWPSVEPTACTGSDHYFSHRVRRDVGRQTTVAWIESVVP